MSNVLPSVGTHDCASTSIINLLKFSFVFFEVLYGMVLKKVASNKSAKGYLVYSIKAIFTSIY